MAPTASEFSPIVTYLFTRREAILNDWRTACEQDPTLAKVAPLSREEFNNLIPIILDTLEQRLLGQPTLADPVFLANSHGLHRWQKAHALTETMQELGLLTQVLYRELQLFQQLYPQTDVGKLLQAHQAVSQLMSETLSGSVQKYDELQRLEASNRVEMLQQAVEQMDEVSRQRGDILRTSSHDLRGSFGLIRSAAYLLRMDELDETERAKFADILNRNLTSVHDLLDNLMDLSRLEAGQEPLTVDTVDVAELLRELTTAAQPAAKERGVVLWADGPASISVETDRLKLQRIIQNLLLNALTYTASATKEGQPADQDRPGIVSVSWSLEGSAHLVFSVQDSGPGLPDNLLNLFARQLKPAVEHTSVTGPEQAEPPAPVPSGEQQIPPGPELARMSGGAAKGEGVGLQIVKRLCELIAASMEIETHPQRGTLFRIRIPIRFTGNS